MRIPAFSLIPALAPLLLATLLTGCGVPTAADWRRCSFTVTDVAFQGLRSEGSEWRIVVAAVNPNGKTLALDGIHLHALMEGDTLARLQDPGRVELAARDTTELSFDVMLPQTAWNKAVRHIQRTGSGELLIAGDVRVPTLFGSRLVKNAVRETHVIDLSSLLGGTDFLRRLRGLFR